MARPPKKGLDYFPLDCHSDTKIRLVEASFGLSGFAIIVKLWQRIYAEEGYYMKWNEDDGRLFALENGNADFDVVSGVVHECLKRGIFNQEKFDKYSILTSKGIQERYLMMTEKRTGTSIVSEYALLSEPSKIVSSEKTGVSSPKTRVSDGRKYTKEKKEKEIKEKETKSNEKKGSFPSGRNKPNWYYSEVQDQEQRQQEQRNLYECSLFDLFEQEFARTISSSECQRLAEWAEQYGDVLVRYALREAIIYDKRSFDYIDRILIAWEQKGLTAEMYENGER